MYLVIRSEFHLWKRIVYQRSKLQTVPIVTIVDNFNSDNSVIAKEKIIYRNRFKAPNKRIKC
jgi:hypothetical protein